MKVQLLFATAMAVIVCCSVEAGISPPAPSPDKPAKKSEQDGIGTQDRHNSDHAQASHKQEAIEEPPISKIVVKNNKVEDKVAEVAVGAIAAGSETADATEPVAADVTEPVVADAAEPVVADAAEPVVARAAESGAAAEQKAAIAEFCASISRQARPEGPRKLIAIFVVQSASDLTVLPMAVAEVAGIASEIAIVTHNSSVANSSPVQYGMKDTYEKLELTGAKWSHLSVDSSDVDLEFALAKFNLTMSDVADQVHAEAIVASARLETLWDGASQLSMLQNMEADNLVLLARSSEIVKEQALIAATHCSIQTPVHFVTQTYRFGFANQDGAWNRPELFTALEAAQLSIAGLRRARENGDEERALGRYPVDFAKSFRSGPQPVFRPGTQMSDAGWHVSLFGGAPIVKMSIRENLTPAAIEAVPDSRLESAVAEAIQHGHEVFYEDTYDKGTVKALESLAQDEIPKLVQAYPDQMSWALNPANAANKAA